MAFHYASHERMLLYEFLLYHLRVVGRPATTETYKKYQLSLTDLTSRFPLENNSYIKDLQQMSEKPDNF